MTIYPVCRKTLITKYGEEAILSTFFPEFRGSGKYKSIFRQEDNDSLVITRKNNNVLISDFGDQSFIGKDVFEFVRRVLNYPDTSEGRINTLKTIQKQVQNRTEIKLENTNQTEIPKIKEKPETVIRYKSRAFFSFTKDYEFWQPLLKDTDKLILEKAFELYNVIFAEYYWVNKYKFKVPVNSPTYIYKLGKYKKLYSPYNKQFKWISNVPKNRIFGLKQLPKTGDLLIIDKSLKDVIVNYLIGVNSITVPSESSFIPIEILEELKQRFKKIIIHLDNDEPGLKAAKLYSEMYNLPFFAFEDKETKDNFEFITKFSLKELKNYYLTKKII